MVTLLSFTACSGSETIKEVELKYDDGISDGKHGLGGVGYGFLVEYEPPQGPYTIKEVLVSGELVGIGYENRKVVILIWDEYGEEIYKISVPHANFEGVEWKSIQIPDIVVNSKFSVVVITDTPREGGFYLHYDSSTENKHSALVQDWEKKPWDVKVSEKETNWMIRVKGTVNE
ncbi:MAG: hypothetical protein ABID67_00185 [Candidatus Nealsonbacteria bacterium]